MRAALCKSLDGPEAVTIEQIEVPRPGPGEALVRVTAVALNHFDTLITRGAYQHKPELPFSPGGEIAGVIEALGPDVRELRVGMRVQAYVGWGGAREKVVVDQERLVPIPDDVPDEVAAGVSITYGTALHGLQDRGRLAAGESVAVLGAAGGAGLAAVEIAKLLGGRVIAVASSAEKLEIAKAHGADTGLNYASGDLKLALRAATEDRGVNVVYDCVGGALSEPALRALDWEGRFLVVGFAAGEIPRFPLNLLLVKGVDVVGVFWGEAMKRNPGSYRRNMEQLFEWIRAGKLKPRIDATFPLDRITDALRVLVRGEAKGKIVVIP
jgi:NADPH2:quinone reductase